MAGWFEAPPRLPEVLVPGWFDSTTPPADVEPEPEIGWWAVLTLDTRETANATQALALQAIKKLALTRLAAASQSMTLRKIAMLALSDTADPTGAVALQKIAMLALSRTAPASQALALVKVMQTALATSQATGTEVLALTRVGVLALTRTAGATATLGLERLVTLAFAETATATAALELIRVQLMDLTSVGPIVFDPSTGAYAYLGYGVGAIGLNSISNMSPFTASRGTSYETASFGFRPTAAATTIVAASGNYTIPRWAEWIDVIVLGGGEAGTGIVWGNGSGGRAGEWNAQRYYRGDDIPWSQTVMQVTVGAGGTGNGGDGGQTYVFPGLQVATLLANGGSGNMGLTNPTGEGVAAYTFQGVSYAGGASQTALGNAGRAPGGGGAGGGFGANVGGAGARGQVWFRAGQG
ncbi:minor tail protein [Mycobacterium phage LilMcDreamy]|uniref:Minor tail protein n=1 Tax=Mycobacterium phage LilMcDreamy TaxID=2652422 RepID=A0A5P8D6N3_9CAUD|nr:minor tail protein [Mycobacterium phage LilMcDreamy]QFP94648.1 minor tail protein [Mycobacterium phage LilMcDreamy]